LHTYSAPANTAGALKICEAFTAPRDYEASVFDRLKENLLVGGSKDIGIETQA
jgi:hypothetical protein